MFNEPIIGEFKPCEDCVNPSGCLTYCQIQDYLSQDTAKIRCETPEQMEGTE